MWESRWFNPTRWYVYTDSGESVFSLLLAWAISRGMRDPGEVRCVSSVGGKETDIHEIKFQASESVKDSPRKTSQRKK
jgi:hypothetical protein